MRIEHRQNSKNDWETPEAVFQPLNEEFGFTLDVCASHRNAKCDFYCTEEGTFFKGISDPWGKFNGLEMPWIDEICWMNPPYDQWQKWVEKAYKESVAKIQRPFQA